MDIDMKVYKRKYLAKKDLTHGCYYKGQCRNAEVARWDEKNQRFVHWRTKFGETFLETIFHPDDDMVYDVFYAEAPFTGTIKEINLDFMDRRG